MHRRFIDRLTAGGGSGNRTRGRAVDMGQLQLHTDINIIIIPDSGIGFPDILHIFHTAVKLDGDLDQEGTLFLKALFF